MMEISISQEATVALDLSLGKEGSPFLSAYA